MSRAPRSVDPMKVHLVTLVVYSTALALVLFVVLFPKVIVFLLITIFAAWLYAKLYGYVEKRLEQMEPSAQDDSVAAIIDDEKVATPLD